LFTVIVVAALLCWVVAFDAAAGDEVMKDGVLHVVNGTESAQGLEKIQLDEVWRAGGEDDEDFFGLVSQVVVTDDGTVYLLDTQIAEVAVYSPTGERIDTLSRQGEGPGETRTPTNLLLMPDGTLGLCQVFPGKITRITRDGTPAGDVSLGGSDPTQGGFTTLFDAVSNAGRLVVCGESATQASPTSQNRTNFVAAIDLEGNESVRYWEKSRELDFTHFVYDEDSLGRIDFRKMALGADGRLYLAQDRNRYAIHVYTPDGELERVIERPYEHQPREAEERERLNQTISRQVQQLPNPEIHVSETEPDIAAVRIGPDGNLWVESSRGGRDQPEGVFYTWDVFTPDGEFLKQVAAVCPGDGREDTLIWTPSGDAVQVTGFTDAVRSLQGGGGGADDDGEAAPMEIIYYRRASS
jgi:hypothetical protein